MDPPNPLSSFVSGSVEILKRETDTENSIKVFVDGLPITFPVQHIGDAGIDLPLGKEVDLTLGPNIISSGISVVFPPGVSGIVHPRSGLCFKSGVYLSLQGGVIDNGYRGEIKFMVFIHQLDKDPSVTTKKFSRGERLFQLCPRYDFTGPVNYMSGIAPTGTDRGVKGFNSTGK